MKGETKMVKSVVDKSSDYIGESVRKASQFTSSVADAVEDGIDVAKRAARDSRDAVEDFVDDTSKHVKRRPIESIMISMAVGLALGFLIGRATSNE
jgi:ElaB/YqjD/DUF883 family membrane-anchored ribosome-binding protein